MLLSSAEALLSGLLSPGVAGARVILPRSGTSTRWGITVCLQILHLHRLMSSREPRARWPAASHPYHQNPTGLGRAREPFSSSRVLACLTTIAYMYAIAVACAIQMHIYL